MKRSREDNPRLQWITRVPDWLLAALLMAAGIAGVFFGVRDVLGLEVDQAKALHLILGTVGLLATALGLERFTQFARFERRMSQVSKRFDDLREDFHSRLNVGIAEGHEKVYADAIRLIGTAEYSIRTIMFTNQSVAAKEFIDAVVAHLQNHVSVHYHVILALDLATMSAQRWEAIDGRTEFFRQAKIVDRCHLKFLQTTKPVGFDVLIVDDRHCVISLSSAPDSPDARREFSIHFEGQPKVAKRMESWIGNIKLFEYEDAKKEWAKKHRSRAASSLTS